MAPNTRSETSDACCRDPLYTAALTFGVIHLVEAIVLSIVGLILLLGFDVSDFDTFFGNGSDPDAVAAAKTVYRLATTAILIVGIVGAGLTWMLISGIKEKSMAKLVTWNVFAGISLLLDLCLIVYTWVFILYPLVSFIITVMYNVRVGREQKQEGNNFELLA